MKQPSEFIIHNPATEEIIARYTSFSSEEIENKIISTHQAWEKWQFSEWEIRSHCAKKLAQLLRDNTAKYAKLITMEMGKPIVQAEQEISKCAWLCEHYAEHGSAYLSKEIILTDKQQSYILYQPLGIVLGIMPWNFPFWQVMRFAIPALLAGNGALLKHSPNVTGCSIALEKLFLAAGFPEHLFTNLMMDVAYVESVIQHPAIAAVTVTGSVKTGSLVASQAGRALKKVVLELGGSDPYIVLADADLEKAAEAILASRYGNAGQSCIAAKRILAVDAIRTELQAIIIDKSKEDEYKFGDPLLRTTKIGPLARADLRENLHKQVLDSVVQGAHLECGGFLPVRMGYFYPATVLTEVPINTPAYNEELFGPIISFIPIKDADHAIHVANSTHFGLSSAIFTQDIPYAEKLAKKLMAGSVSINHFTASDPRLPFGGIKHSGFGRELGVPGIHEFTNMKVVSIK